MSNSNVIRHFVPSHLHLIYSLIFQYIILILYIFMNAFAYTSVLICICLWCELYTRFYENVALSLSSKFCAERSVYSNLHLSLHNKLALEHILLFCMYHSFFLSLSFSMSDRCCEKIKYGKVTVMSIIFFAFQLNSNLPHISNLDWQRI